MYVYIHIYEIYMYIYIHICMYIYTHMYTSQRRKVTWLPGQIQWCDITDIICI